MVLRSAAAQKYQLLAVGRPPGRGVAIKAGCDVVYALRRPILRQLKDGDKAVVPSSRRKRDALAVRRPLRLGFLPAQLGQLPCRLAVAHVRDPEMMFRPHPGHPLSVRRHLYVLAIVIAAHIADQARLSRLYVGSPYLLLGLLDLAHRVGHVPLAV